METLNYALPPPRRSSEYDLFLCHPFMPDPEDIFRSGNRNHYRFRRDATTCHSPLCAASSATGTL